MTVNLHLGFKKKSNGFRGMEGDSTWHWNSPFCSQLTKKWY